MSKEKVRKTGGNNLALVSQEQNPVLCIPGSTTDHHAVFTRQRCDKFQEGDVVSTQSAHQHKDATDLICQIAAELPLLIRRLTPRECERLQGFPDDWTNLPGAADAPRYRALGNSVAIPCVEYLMWGMALALRAG